MSITAFHYRAVGSDGKLRTGMITAETTALVARELRRQGLTPVYVGAQEKKSFSLNLPAFGGNRRKDVLFFTQELSTLLNSGVPLDRALGITTELTTHANFRAIVSEILRAIKGGKSLADSLALHPALFSELFINMVRAGEASGSLGQIFERLSEFERSRDELRGYIISSMIYPSLLALVGAASVFVLLDFVVPRFAGIFEDGRMQIPVPTKIMLDVSKVVQDWSWVVALVFISGVRYFPALQEDGERQVLVGQYAPEDTAAGRSSAQSRNLAVRARHVNACGQFGAAGAVASHLGGDSL